MDGARDCVVRILRKGKSVAGDTVGTGILVSEWHVLTCAHVVAESIGIRKGCAADDAIGRITPLVLRPLNSAEKKKEVLAKVVGWHPVRAWTPNHQIEDVAVLELLEPAEFAHSGNLAAVLDGSELKYGAPVSLFGFGEYADWVDCTVKDYGEHWLQVNCEGLKVSPGYSGAVVFDATRRKILGMLILGNSERPVVRVIRAALLQDAWRAATATPVRTRFGKTPLDAHVEATKRALRADAASAFFGCLRSGLSEAFPQQSEIFGNPEKVCDWFACQPAEAVREMMEVIRAAMKAVREHAQIREAQRQATADAAVALFCLAACRLVQTTGGVAQDYILALQESPAIIYGVITTALLGGVLKLATGEIKGLGQSGPVPKHVIEVELLAGSENLAEHFERSVYAQLLHIHGEVTDARKVRDASGPLSDIQSKQLVELIVEYRKRERLSLTLVVTAADYRQAAQQFAKKYEACEYRLPLIVPATTDTSVLLAMDVNELTNAFWSFWRNVQRLRAGY